MTTVTLVSLAKVREDDHRVLSSYVLFVILAVNIPSRNRAETDIIRTNPMMNKSDQENDNTDGMSDEFDSDSKENENVSKSNID
jgi:hypothetical protein